MRLSIVIEWANTQLNGVLRAWDLLDALEQQWPEIVKGVYPAALPPACCRFLDELDPCVEVLIVSGSAMPADVEAAIRQRISPRLEIRIHVSEGLEYYPLKNFGGELATGDLLLFVDSDVTPEDGWLAHLIGSFADPEIDVVCGQTYVAPVDLMSRAFAVGWTYPLRRSSMALSRPRKFYANTIAFRTAVFRRTGFPSIGARTRGASSLLAKELERQGGSVWENPAAAVRHPPPSGLHHLAVRALAHGRDQYMQRSEERHLSGLGRSVGLATTRLGYAFYRILRERRQVGLRVWELPPVFAICSAYHALFALGGVLTHLSPKFTARRFRV